MSKIRIGIVIYNTGHKGGAERRYFNLINELAKTSNVYILANSSIYQFWNGLGTLNDSVVLSTLFKDREIKETKNNGLIESSRRERVLETSIRRLIPKQLRSSLLEIKKKMILNYKVLAWAKKNLLTHINCVQGAAVFTFAAKLAKRKIIFSYVDYMVENGYPFTWFHNHGLKSVVKFADKYDFLSEMIPKRIIDKGLPLDKNKINVAPISFTDYSKFYVGHPKKKNIVFAGRFESIKNPLLALSVAKELTAKKIDFHLKMIGYGSLETEIRNFVIDNSISDRVSIFASEDIQNELSDAIIFLSLQAENNYPSQALLEAMAAGCIPIVTDVGETRKLVNPEIGYLVQPNVHQISEIVERIMIDIESYSQKSESIRAFVLSNFNSQQYLKYYLNLFYN